MFNTPVVSISQPLTSGPQEIVTFLRFLEQVPGVVVRKENNDLYHWETNSLIPYDIGNKVAQILNANNFTCNVDDTTHSWRYIRNAAKLDTLQNLLLWF